MADASSIALSMRPGDASSMRPAYARTYVRNERTNVRGGYPPIEISPVRYAREKQPDPPAETCPAAKHGTRAAYYTHGCRCPEARSECSLYERRRSKEALLGRPRAVPLLGTARRLQALNALGWTMAGIAKAGDLDAKYLAHLVRGANRYTYRETAARVRAVYELLCMTPGPSSRARALAQAKGYAPPLAWDEGDIDDPDARPHGHVWAASDLPRKVRARVGDGRVDAVVVEETVAGTRSPLVVLTLAEQDEVVRRMHALHRPDSAIALALGRSTRHARRIRRRLGLGPAVDACGEPLAG